MRASRWALALVLAAGCKDSAPPLVPTTVSLSTSQASMDAIGATLPFTISVKDQNSSAMPSVTPTVTSSTPSVATASVTGQSGVVTAVANGNTSITVTAGPVSAAISVTVDQAPTSVTKLAGDGQTGLVGTVLAQPLRVKIVDRLGMPIGGREISFAAVTGGGATSPPRVVTQADGTLLTNWTLGPTSGSQSIAATVSGRTESTTFTSTALPGPVSALSAETATTQSAAPGTTVAAAPSVRVVDRYGNGVPAATVTFAVTAGGGSITAGTATSNASGVATVGSWTLGVATGVNTLTASTAGATAVIFSAIAGSGPVISSLFPTALVPGTSVAINGTSFAPSLSGNSVTINGVAATVTAASATQITATVPCLLSGAASVVVTTVGSASPVVGATIAGTPRTIAPGQAYLATSSAASACTELAASSGPTRYLISITNTSPSQNAFADVELGGNPAPSSGLRVPLIAPRRAMGSATGGESDRDAAHLAHMEFERNRYAALRAAGATRRGSLRAATALPAVGDRRVFTFPWSSCNDTTTTIVAHALYVGTRAIVWEDSANGLQSGLDAGLLARYQRLGKVFDLDQYDVIRNTFGDPLLRDAQTDGDGRVHMIFSRRVNALGGVAAFVSSADQFPHSACPSSNVGEFFYSSVPTTTGSNLENAGYPDGWYNFINRTVVHEVKHIASMAARVANNAPAFETSWLEEGTARVAEEVWARGYLHHTSFLGNSGWGTAADNGVYCDFNPSNLVCAANDTLRRPSYGVRRQFNEILPKLQTPWNWSVFGDGNGQSGSVFYQTVWSLVRYAIDRYAVSDAAFLTALTSSTATGTTTLSNVAGVPFDQLMAQWTLALYADDYPGLASPSADVRIRTWNLRDIYSNLDLDPAWRSRFSTPFPIEPATVPFGIFTAQQTSVRGGANVYFELSGTPSGAQLLQLRAPGGGVASPFLRIAITRLQ